MLYTDLDEDFRKQLGLLIPALFRRVIRSKEVSGRIGVHRLSLPLTARQNPPPPRLISASPVVRGERVFRQSLFGPRNALFKHLSWRSEDGSGYETLGSDRQPCELSVL